ncbi:MAG TPA: choice-of-anchor Q domain-containing protein [Candidatus Solibacter sp.]|nr:choice-of-anchor Q domain-containing protein [Candidatus Solibacter sp.]
MLRTKMGKRGVVVALIVALTCAFAASAGAITIHVPADQSTIQAAIDAANTGDLVLVSPGTYTENIDFHGKAITVRSMSGAPTTIIDGGNVGTVVTFQTGETTKSVLTGFTIQHGSASFGAGITMLGASATITRNIFRNNAQGSGGFGAAIGGNSASPVVERNLFTQNTCDTQFLSGVVSFVNSSSPLIINNIFERNPCRAINMTLPTGNSPVVANNTIVQNSVGVRVDARVVTAEQLYANNILVGNQVGLEVDFLNTGNEPTWTNNLVSSNPTNYSGIADETGTNGNISANPKFVSLTKLNLHLLAGSPAIDAGTLSVPKLPSTDYAGNPRVVDGNGDGVALPDMGAYELIP